MKNKIYSLENLQKIIQKEKKMKYESSVFVMVSACFIDDVIKISDFKGSWENQHIFLSFYREKLVDPSNESLYFSLLE